MLFEHDPTGRARGRSSRKTASHFSGSCSGAAFVLSDLADLGVFLEEDLVGVLGDILRGIWTGRGPAFRHEDLHLAYAACARYAQNLVGLIAGEIADHVE